MLSTRGMNTLNVGGANTHTHCYLYFIIRWIVVSEGKVIRACVNGDDQSKCGLCAWIRYVTQKPPHPSLRLTLLSIYADANRRPRARVCLVTACVCVYLSIENFLNADGSSYTVHNKHELCTPSTLSIKHTQGISKKFHSFFVDQVCYFTPSSASFSWHYIRSYPPVHIQSISSRSSSSIWLSSVTALAILSSILRIPHQYVVYYYTYNRGLYFHYVLGSIIPNYLDLLLFLLFVLFLDLLFLTFIPYSMSHDRTPPTIVSVGNNFFWFISHYICTRARTHTEWIPINRATD